MITGQNLGYQRHVVGNYIYFVFCSMKEKEKNEPKERDSKGDCDPHWKVRIGVISLIWLI